MLTMVKHIYWCTIFE